MVLVVLQECHWLHIRYPQPLHVLLVSRLQLAFWTHYYEHAQVISAIPQRTPVTTAQPDTAKLCAFWSRLSAAQQDSILEGNAPALTFHADKTTSPELVIQRLLRCPLQWVCHDCGAAASVALARLLEQYADSIAEELGTTNSASPTAPSPAAKHVHKPKRRKKTRPKHNGKSRQHQAITEPGKHDHAAAHVGSVSKPHQSTLTAPLASACTTAPVSPRDVSHEGTVCVSAFCARILCFEFIILFLLVPGPFQWKPFQRHL